MTFLLALFLYGLGPIDYYTPYKYGDYHPDVITLNLTVRKYTIIDRCTYDSTGGVVIGSPQFQPIRKAST